MDKFFKVETLRATPNPQQAVWLAMHTCYSANYVLEHLDKTPGEKESGEYIVKHLLAGDRGHYSPLEIATIVFACGYWPHSLVQQLTRHRILSFSIQSFRYTGTQIIEVAKGDRDIESVFYFRPIGEYSDRSGNRYKYTQEMRDCDRGECLLAAELYARKIECGLSEEHARELIPYCVRQHFVMGCNARSLMHLLDLRWRRDAQLEAQWFSELLFERFKDWIPALADWYFLNRSHKGRLAP